MVWPQTSMSTSVTAASAATEPPCTVHQHVDFAELLNADRHGIYETLFVSHVSLDETSAAASHIDGVGRCSAPFRIELRNEHRRALAAKTFGRMHLAIQSRLRK